jgi:hypothetical protein
MISIFPIALLYDYDYYMIRQGMAQFASRYAFVAAMKDESK